jgi:hypothetical protein
MNARLNASSAAVAAAMLLLASPALCQTSGTSHPEALNDAITTDVSPQPAQRYTKPSPAIPMAADPATPQQPAPVLRTHESAPSSLSESRSYTTVPEAETAYVRHAEPDFVVTDDVNSGVVISVPTKPDELPEGALLHAQLVAPISTDKDSVGSRFAASLTEEVRHDGKVILPAGTLVRGRISDLHGGRRIGGPPSIRLRPESVLLPDGTTYEIGADVVDLDHYMDSKVNSEGSIVANEHPKAILGALGLVTGSAMAAGAVVGGGVGAVVGATVGAGVGTIWWLKKDRQEALPTGTEIVFSLDRPMPFGSAAR